MNRSSNGFLPVVYGFKPTVVYGSVPITYALLVIERMRTDANQSSDGFAPTIYARSVIERTRTNANRSSNGFAPTIHALSVLERTRTYANRSSNRFTSPIYDFSHCRVFYSTLRGQDTLRDEVQPYASRSFLHVQSPATRRRYATRWSTPLRIEPACRSLPDDRWHSSRLRRIGINVPTLVHRERTWNCGTISYEDPYGRTNPRAYGTEKPTAQEIPRFWLL